MFWKILLALGFFGLMLSLILIVVFVKMFYGASNNPTEEDIAFGGLLIGVLSLIISFLVTIVSLIFVLRSSKKKWEAENPKT